MDYILKGTIGSLVSVIAVSAGSVFVYTKYMRPAFGMAAGPLGNALNIMFWFSLAVGLISLLNFSFLVTLLSYYRTVDSTTTN